MPTDIGRLYDTLHAAIAADEFVTAEETLQDIAAAYDQAERTERRTIGRALAVRNEQIVPTDVQKQVTDIATQHVRVDQSRMMALIAARGYLTNPVEEGKDELLDNLSQMQDYEETAEGLLDNAESLVSEVTVPPKVENVALDGPEVNVPKSEVVVVEAEVENVGDESAVDITIEQESSLNLTPSSLTEGDLAGGNATTVEFSGTATTSGTYTVRVTADAGNSRPATDEIDLVVIDKSEAARASRSLLEELRTIIEESSDITRGLETSLLELVSNAERHVDRALTHIESNDPEAADNHLRVAIKQLGAFLNRLDADHGGGNAGNGRGNEDIPSSLRRTLEQVAESTIDKLTLAQRAAI